MCVCPHYPGCAVVIGELTAPRVEEPLVPDDTVRWYKPGFGWGVIAHSDGDAFVHFSAIEGEGFKELTEGERVEWEPEDARQGAFRRLARRVRRLSSQP
jgi:cold shock protein